MPHLPKHRIPRRSLISAALAALAALGFSAPAQCQSAAKLRAVKPALAKALALQAAPPPDFKTPTLYQVGYTHLDTEWCWSYPQVIGEFIPNTLHQNFALFEKYPDYIFNWTGANRYKFMKEYYPADYQTLKEYVAAGRWYPNGSSLEEGDVDIPSEESIIRQVMYGNDFFRHEFGEAGSDFMLPDCFGFPASLPSILAHCGVKGFSTQKLTWGSAVGIPFNVGVWDGPDGQSVFAALNAGDYNGSIDHDYSQDTGWLKRIDDDRAKASGLAVDYRYYGLGDRGGSVRSSDAAGLEASLSGTGPIHVISARADQLFNDLTPADKAKLPHYKGDLLLTFYSSGSTTSQAEMKRWNHENEKLADATERASVTADWLGALPYDKARITDAWWKFLPGQFHDLMAGTALPASYEFAWNDQVLALNEFADTLQDAIGGVARGLDTRGAGIPLVVYNPLSQPRRDVVEATITFPGAAPQSVRVTGPGDAVVPAQIESRSGHSLRLLLPAFAPPVGCAVYTVQPGTSPSASELKVTPSSLENAHYRVRLNAAGDVASIYDKSAGRELLSAPMRLSFQYENPAEYPAWNMDYGDQMKQPEGYVDGPAKITITERGPVRAALTVDRSANDSHVVETIRLASGPAGDRVEFFSSIDWQSKECALMAVLPLTVSNSEATYNWELGTIRRATDDPAKYEVPTHQWLDLTDTSRSYGVSVLSGDRYGSDKPDDHTLRLTLLYTPGVRGGYTHEKTQDWGHHELLFAVTGHSGDWVTGDTQWKALRMDRPLIAFQTTAHPGPLARSFAFAQTSSRFVSVEALKQAEASHEVVVRFNELAGREERNVQCSFLAPILAAREINGQEQPLNPSGEPPAAVRHGKLVFDMTAYRPRAFALTLGAPAVKLEAPTSRPLTLAYNVNTEKAFGSASGGSFDDAGNALPADMLPASLVSSGIRFSVANSAEAGNAVECRGQTISLPKAAGGRLYLLAASDKGDVPATFTVAGKPQTRTIEAWNGKIGQWDNRVWGGEVPKLTYDQTNPMIGLTPGYIKRDPVAWFSDHTRAADGSNTIYAYCYLFRYALDIPGGAASVRLPDNPHVKILAATLASDPNTAVTPAQPLYDTLQHPIDEAPVVDADQVSGGASTLVTISHPLYFSPSASLHYTLDGTAPTAESPVYTNPFPVTQAARVKAAYIDSAGTVEGTTSAQAAVAHPSGLQVLAVTDAGPKVLQVTFSEPVSEASAENPANYQSLGDTVLSARLGPDQRTVTLKLGPVKSYDGPWLLSVQGVESSAVPALPATGALNVPVTVISVAFAHDDVQTFDGSTPGYSAQPTTPLPTAAGAAWTMNLFAYFDTTPGELTTLAGFGDDSDTAGTQRYLLKFHDGIHFWASSVDVTSGVPYDLGKWQMVTATYDGKTLTLYKNGQAIKSADISLSDAAPVVKIAPPGPWQNGGHLKGRIAGFRLWSVTLSPDAVAGLMQSEPKS